MVIGPSLCRRICAALTSKEVPKMLSLTKDIAASFWNGWWAETEERGMQVRGRVGVEIEMEGRNDETRLHAIACTRVRVVATNGLVLGYNFSSAISAPAELGIRLLLTLDRSQNKYFTSRRRARRAPYQLITLQASRSFLAHAHVKRPCRKFGFRSHHLNNMRVYNF